MARQAKPKSSPIWPGIPLRLDVVNPYETFSLEQWKEKTSKEVGSHGTNLERDRKRHEEYADLRESDKLRGLLTAIGQWESDTLDLKQA